jgi:hypothetical protein
MGTGCCITPQFLLSNIITVIKSRRMRWARYVARRREMRDAGSIFVGKLEGNRLLGRSRRRWEDNILMDL